VSADDTKAIDAVLRADKKRTALLEEEKALSVEVEKGNKLTPLFNKKINSFSVIS
jgi:hypothetical protein